MDNENSTHLNSDCVGREEIPKRIASIQKRKLIEYLRYPEETDFKLLKIISEKTEPKDRKHHGKRNLSFASKFCHYMCLFLFEGEPEQDNYPIYDSVIKNNLNQRCLVHQVRNTLKYVPDKDRKAFAKDLKTIYNAPSEEDGRDGQSASDYTELSTRLYL